MNYGSAGGLSYTDGVLQRNDDIFYSCGTFTIFHQQYVF